MSKILASENKVLRHRVIVRIIHWTIAASVFVLIFSGFGQMPLYKRYLLTDIWPSTGDYWLLLKMHYVAAVVLTAAACWHAIYHLIRKDFGLLPRRGDFKESVAIIKAMLTGKEEPPADKYLAEQRLAYVFIAASLALVIITGLVKTAKNHGVFIADGIQFAATHLHNLAAVLVVAGIVAHLGAFAIPANRRLLMSMVTGKVDLEYARHRHSIWFNRLLGRSKARKPGAKTAAKNNRTV